MFYILKYTQYSAEIQVNIYLVLLSCYVLKIIWTVPVFPTKLVDLILTVKGWHIFCQCIEITPLICIFSPPFASLGSVWDVVFGDKIRGSMSVATQQMKTPENNSKTIPPMFGILLKNRAASLNRRTKNLVGMKIAQPSSESSGVFLIFMSPFFTNEWK